MLASEQTIAKQISYKQNPKKNSPNYFLPKFNHHIARNVEEMQSHCVLSHALQSAPSYVYPVKN